MPHGTKTVIGVQGSPFRPPFGSFAGKPASTGKNAILTVMGVQGSPFRPPFGSFAGKPASVSGAHYQPIINSYPGRMWNR